MYASVHLYNTVCGCLVLSDPLYNLWYDYGSKNMNVCLLLLEMAGFIVICEGGKVVGHFNDVLTCPFIFPRWKGHD